MILILKIVFYWSINPMWSPTRDPLEISRKISLSRTKVSYYFDKSSPQYPPPGLGKCELLSLDMFLVIAILVSSRAILLSFKDQTDVYQWTGKLKLSDMSAICHARQVRSKRDRISPRVTAFHHVWPHFTTCYRISPRVTAFHHVLPHFITCNRISPRVTAFYLV